MSSEAEIRKRAKGRDRTARWRAGKASERVVLHALAELRTQNLLNIMKALHAEVDAADEAGDDSWLFQPRPAGTGISLRTEKHQLCQNSSTLLTWQRPLCLSEAAPKLVYVKGQRTGAVLSASGDHLGDIPFSYGSKPGLFHDGPRAPSETNCTQLQLEVVDWVDAPTDCAIAQEVLSTSGEHVVTAVHIPWNIVAEAGNFGSVMDAQQVFRDVIVETRTAATSQYKDVSGASIGRYIELGWGCMTGKHRKATQVFPDGESSLLPFWKDDNIGRPNMHTVVSEVSASLAEVMFNLDNTLLEGYNSGARPWPAFAEALTYPLPLPGRRYLHGAQCTSRVRGTWLQSTAAEVEAAARASCPLHCDKQVPCWPWCPLHWVPHRRIVHQPSEVCDTVTQDSGHHDRGGVIAYSLLHEDPEQQRSASMLNHRLKHADLLVFEARQGGRGVRVRTAKADALILVFMRSSRCLHGNPINEEPGSDAPGVLHGRFIHYGLQKIDTFVSRMAENPSLLDQVKEYSDEFGRERLEKTLNKDVGVFPPIPCMQEVLLQEPPSGTPRTPTGAHTTRSTMSSVTSSVAVRSVNSLELPTPPSPKELLSPLR